MGSIGSKYETTKGLRTVQVAALIRADIKAAVAAGELPAGKYSVRTRGSSLHSAIDVTFHLVGDVDVFSRANILWRDANPHAWIGSAPVAARELHSCDVVSTTKKLEEIVNAYNRDDSDIQTDYFDRRFYEHIGPCSDWESERREIEQLRARGFVVSKELFGDEIQAVAS